METQQHFLTRDGLRRLQEEYDELLDLRRARIKNESPRIMVSDAVNEEYLTFYEDFNLIELQLSRLENVMKNAAIIQPPAKGKRDSVDVGATVTLEADGKDYNFEITGAFEADPANGKISCESPVGAALAGHRIGDAVALSHPIKTMYWIRDIRYRGA